MATHWERVRTARYPRLCAPYRRERRVRKAKRAHRQHRVAPQFRCTEPWFETRGCAALLYHEGLLDYVSAVCDSGTLGESLSGVDSSMRRQIALILADL